MPTGTASLKRPNTRRQSYLQCQINKIKLANEEESIHDGRIFVACANRFISWRGIGFMDDGTVTQCFGIKSILGRTIDDKTMIVCFMF